MISNETKTIIWISVITIIIVAGGLYFWNTNPDAIAPGGQSVVVDRTQVVATNSNINGLITAKVIVTEFGDYECPACAVAHPITQALEEKYKDNPDVAFVFRNFPLPQHRHAMLSAQFAESAGLQGKFWEMHDILYEHQNEWLSLQNAEDIFTTYAINLGLDINKLKIDIKSDVVLDRINADKTAVGILGINSTPTFYVNGVKQSSWSMQELSTAIDIALAE